MKKTINILIFIAIFSQSYASGRIISGRVNQMGGSAIPGVKVAAFQAPSIFTLTDAKGEYKLEIPEEVQKLEFSYVGMQTKVVKIGSFNTVNIILIPSDYRKIRFGAGIAGGGSIFTARTDPDIHFTDTTASISMNGIALHLDLSYRINKRFDVQAVLEEDVNYFDYIDENGDNQRGGIFRTNFSVPVNFNMVIGKSGNYSSYIGVGPQLDYFGIFGEMTIGLRIQAGFSINNYGFNTRFYLASDVTGGTIKGFEEVENFKFDYSSIKLGVLFYF